MLSVAIVVTVVLSACGGEATDEAAAPAPTTTASDASVATDPPTTGVTNLDVEVTATYPHDPTAFTQGLEILDDGHLVESTGGYGESALRRVEVSTGTVLDEAELPASHFGEGVTAVGDRLVQLTWQEGTAFVYEVDDLTVVDRFEYTGEGWGLCLLGDRLIMSDGSPTLTWRDPVTFAAQGQVEVTLLGQPVEELNELECVDGRVWANVWRTDTIVGIDPGTGEVEAVVDAGDLLDRAAHPSADVLNGIAWDEASGTFLLTGKWWPTVFRVRFVPA